MTDAQEAIPDPGMSKGVGQRFMRFCERFSAHFQLGTRSAAMPSEHDLCGLMQAQGKNMERMTEVVPASDDQALQHF